MDLNLSLKVSSDVNQLETKCQIPNYIVPSNCLAKSFDYSQLSSNKSYLEISLISIKHAIKPFQEFLGTMITMDHHWHSIMLGHEPCMLSSSNGSQNGCLLLVILDTFACQKGSSTIGKLNNHWWLNVTGCLQHCINGWSGSAIEGRQSNLCIQNGKATDIMREKADFLTLFEPWKLTALSLQCSINFIKLSPVTTPGGTISMRPIFVEKNVWN